MNNIKFDKMIQSTIARYSKNSEKLIHITKVNNKIINYSNYNLYHKKY